jgi:hypothetical protein
VPEDKLFPPRATPSNLKVPALVIGSVTQKFKTEFDFDTESIEKIEVGKKTDPDIALKGVESDAIKTFIVTRSPTSKLPVEGLTESEAAFTKDGPKKNIIENIIIE